jgi:hypothetical protein
MAIVVAPPMYVWGYRVPDDLARNFVRSAPFQPTPHFGSLPLYYYVPTIDAMQTMSQERTDYALLLRLARIREFGYTETVLWLEEDPWPWQCWPHLHNYLAASPRAGTWYPRRRRQQVRRKNKIPLPGDIEVTHGGRHDKIRFQEPEKKLLWW